MSTTDQSIEEKHFATVQELVNRTLNSLNRLGSQRFAIGPFRDHFDRWISNLGGVVSEFSLSHVVTVDDQFERESSQILTNIELALNEKRSQETSHQEAIRQSNRNLLQARSTLAQIEREYATKAKELALEKERTITPLAKRAGRLGEELNRIVKMRAGFLRRISRQNKAQKQTETTQQLDSTKSQLVKIERSFASEEEKLQNEYQRKKQQTLEQIASYQEQNEILEADSPTDDAVDIRHDACEALTNAVNSLLQRTKPKPEHEDASA